jgi:hypothetical protein
MEAPMDLVFLVKQRLKKLGKKDYFNWHSIYEIFFFIYI